METLYSIRDAAKKLGGISEGTIRFWLSTGRLQRTKVGSRTMVAESALTSLIDVGGVSPSPRKRKKQIARTEMTKVA